MKTITFEPRYFATPDKWRYFLEQIGIKDDPDTIESVYLRIDKSETYVYLRIDKSETIVKLY